MQYQHILDQIHEEIAPTLPQGRIADYIPQLACVDERKLGMAICDVDGGFAWVGDADERFSIQSISKVFTLTQAVRTADAQLWRRVGREPSGTAFNSLVQLEFENGIPRNPFINAGALVVTDIVLSHLGDAKAALREFARRLSGADDIDYDLRVADSEARLGYRNAALAYFLKSFGNLENHPDQVLDAYFHHCALSMSCAELARSFMYLARHGLNSDGEVISSSQAKAINSLMLTSGTYDAVGAFAYSVGLPAKSGVGGGIVAVMPGMFSLCVWAPGLDGRGNSMAGSRALERFAELSGQSIF
ncbi:glutaminase [Oleiagrimonas sp. MCCC 1A03011]|uniref:glutaminase n=1 Tax=Oleiagrimonas sp. MCCC 1A03011 TaxID=1926883 RepID=UPI000DC3B3DD|nr:glutaminase [Oleiagrimonas sp. MCCC 1A03011]RAP57713.1 glutaminase [Oleiagrimonas sp. MCCC 1A03011]